MSRYSLQSLLRSPRRPVLGTMPIHTPSGLSGVHSVANRHFDTTCDVIRLGGTPDGFGGTTSETTIAGSWPCNVQRAAASTEGVTAGSGDVTDATLYEIGLPPEANVQDDDRLAIPGLMPEWESLTTYGMGDRVIATTTDTASGAWFACVSPGTAGANEPAWNVQQNGTTRDGSAIWEMGGYVSILEVVGHDRAQSSQAQLVVRAKEWK